MTSADELAKHLEQLNRKWMESYVNRDVSFLQRHVADEYVSTFPDGTTLDKQGENRRPLIGGLLSSAKCVQAK